MSQNPIINRRAISRRVLALDGVLPHDKLVLLALVDRMRVEGPQARQAWPRIEQIAIDVGGGAQHVRKGLVRLENAGLVQRWRQSRGYLYRVAPTWDEVPVSAPIVRMREPSTEERDSWR